MTGVRSCTLILGAAATRALFSACGSNANTMAGPSGDIGGSAATDGGDASSGGSGIRVDSGAAGAGGGCSANEDGSIPQKELPNYTQPGLNNFRQNKQPGREFAAPDAVVSVAPRCTGAYGLTATTRPLYPADSEAVFLPLPNAPAAVRNGAIHVYAVVDDTQTPHPDWTECRTDNNQSAPVSAACAQIH